MNSNIYTADFETTTDENDCRVWAWGVCEIGKNEEFEYNNSIESFFEHCKKLKNSKMYFHNLKFDGQFIISYLENNNFQHINDKKLKETQTYTTLISDMGQFYEIEVYFKVKNKKVEKVTFIDSLKILNMGVSDIAETFKLDVQKLKLDYNKKREKDHILTDHEVEYLKCDVTIMSKALNIMFSKNLKKMTIGSDALNNFKEMLGKDKFNKYFPILDYEIDKEIRKSYKGGFTYLNPFYAEKDVKKGIVLDVNSLYPSVMYFEKLPYGQPIFFSGEYKEDKLYPLYVQNLSCYFKLKKNKIPTIQLKNNMSFMSNEYITDSKEIVNLTLTNIDLKLFFENYDVTDITYHSGFKFRGIVGIFRNYIDYWSNVKIESKKTGNSGMYKISKLMLNSLYGKFGLNPEVRSKIPFLDKNDGIIKYNYSDKEIRESIYIPLATFITSYARYKTITTSQKIKDYSLRKYGKDLYIYSDTDSIHCLIENVDELKDIIDIDSYRLGAWDHESTFTKARFIRQKCYAEELNGKMKITCAGLPTSCYDNVNWDNFHVGFTCGGKLTYKYVKGGVVLIDTEFTIKENKILK